MNDKFFLVRWSSSFTLPSRILLGGLLDLVSQRLSDDLVNDLIGQDDVSLYVDNLIFAHAGSSCTTPKSGTPRARLSS